MIEHDTFLLQSLDAALSLLEWGEVAHSDDVRAQNRARAAETLLRVERMLPRFDMAQSRRREVLSRLARLRDRLEDSSADQD